MNNKKKENNMNNNNNNLMKVYYLAPSTRFENGKEVYNGFMTEASAYVRANEIDAYAWKQQLRLAGLGLSNPFKILRVVPSDVMIGKEDLGMSAYVNTFGTASE